jgi:hypothetical protein
MTDTVVGRAEAWPVDPPQDVWVIVDGDGLPVGPPWDHRRAALRSMGILAAHGASLPLVLYGVDGRPTGDRLP